MRTLSVNYEDTMTENNECKHECQCMYICITYELYIQLHSIHMNMYTCKISDKLTQYLVKIIRIVHLGFRQVR